MTNSAIPDTPPLRVLVAAPTFHRPDDIAELVPLLMQQARDCASEFDCHVRVLVIDNDPAGSARTKVEALPGARYVCEPEPGIAAARNRALDEGFDDDVLVFIDDDERPEPDWLGALIRTWTAERPAAVSGHVLSLYDDDVDPWIRAGNYFHRPNPPTGTERHVLASGNLLLDLTQIRDRELRFDHRYGLTGGEDTFFTRQLHDRGGRMIWCAESRTTDRVPADRLTRKWLAMRAFRGGNTAVRIDLDLAPEREFSIRAKHLGRGVLRTVAGSSRYLVGKVGQRLDHQAKGTRTMMRGLGLIAGSVGHVYQEYARTESGTV